MREPRDNDFFIPLPGVGNFRYGRKTFGDRLAIRSGFLELTNGGNEDDETVNLYAGFIASHRVLCVSSPQGWEDIAQIDLTSSEDIDDKILELFSLLDAKEDSFRKGATKSGETDSPGDV